MARVVLAVHEPFVLLGTRATIDAEGDLTVVGTASRIADVWGVVERAKPDVLVLDAVLHAQDKDVMQRVVQRLPDCRVVMMVTHSDEQCTLRALLAGPKDCWPGRDVLEHVQECCLMALRESARGCVPRGADPSELVQAIRAVLKGEVWAGPAVAEYLLETLKGDARRADAAHHLTTREIEVIGLVVDGLSNREIAERLGLGEQTVKNHLARVMSKLSLRNRVELALHAVRERIA